MKRIKEKPSYNDYLYRIPGFLIMIVCLVSEIYLRVKGLSTPDFTILESSFPGLLTIAIFGMFVLGIPLFEPLINLGLKIYKKLKG